MEGIGKLTVTHKTVEIRIPTYKRPELLRRALNSILEQSYSDWVAIVFDDSPEQEANYVVKSFNHSRIIYQPNETNLGGGANVDQAFFANSFIEGTGYATILEDDNWWYPDFLKSNIEALQSENVQMLMRNQEVWEHSADKEPSNTGRTTRGNWMKEGIISPFTFHSYLFFFEGVSTGGMLWETSCRSDLQVGESIKDAGLQEYCRTLQVEEPILFLSKPLAVWTKMRPEDVSRYLSSDRVWGRGRQAVLNYLIKHYGKTIIRKAETIAIETGRYDLLDYAMADIHRLSWKCRSTGSFNCFKLKTKSLARRLFVTNPLGIYLQKKRPLG